MQSRKKTSHHLLAAVGVLTLSTLFALNGCNSGNPTGPLEGIFADLSGQLTSSKTLSADSTYLLSGTFEVITPDTAENPTVLTVPAGTVILGEQGTNAEMIVREGAKLMLLGEATGPIVFSSSRAIGARASGDWVGITIEGAAPVNNPTATFGGNDETDSSGIIRYTRIEFAGANGAALTLSGVGIATDIHHLQIHRSAGGGVLIEGGTAALYRVLVTSPAGTGVAWSDGWTGYGQFWVVARETNGSGIAGSNGSAGDFAAPISAPTLYNLTLLGNGVGDGISLTDGSHGWIRNSIIQNFEAALHIDGSGTEQAFIDTVAGLDYSILYDNDTLAVSDGSLQLDSLLLDTLFLNRTNDPQLLEPFDLLAPNFAAASGSPTYKLDSLYEVPDSVEYLEWTRYLGAVYLHATSPWIGSWVTFDVD